MIEYFLVTVQKKHIMKQDEGFLQKKMLQKNDEV
jgi:hypothetical protein